MVGLRVEGVVADLTLENRLSRERGRGWEDTAWISYIREGGDH